ncbi:6-bladed beta-propeller [Algoriphagus persicinus]|uniref:6-bladed beta-propeller n=1 Tax=Algoriphagus persicinus TaxID=3108754 RepID=UPI002B38EEA9|nr:6-bladed beta-propeller [Algoriphagus sp. E1-3-M2]MEB2786924.1 6-bladed beta-propeller [Algoriphagus sp. E1-3-M2]
MKYIYLFSALLLFTYCQNKNNVSSLSNTHFIDPTSGTKISLSEIIADITVIQPNEGVIIADGKSILLYDNKIIIKDNTKQKTVQVVDSSGNFLFEIKATGEGPGQFKTPSLVRVNQTSDRILIYCALTKKIIQFDWKGNLIEETSLKEIGLVGDFLVRNNEILFLNVMTIDPKKRIGKLNLKTYEKDKKITYLEDYPGEYIKVQANKSQFFFQPKDVEYFYFLDLFSTNLVKMTWEGEYTINQFTFNNNSLILDATKIYNPTEIIDQLHVNEYFHIGDHINIGDRYIAIPIEKGMVAYATILFDTNKNTVKIISEFDNGLEGLLPSQALPPPAGPYSGTATINIDPDYAYEKIKVMNLDQNKFTSELKKIKTPNNQNPVFIIYHLK